MTASGPTLLSGAAFEALFSSFESTAFRLETRESYYEQDELAAFLEEGPTGVPSDFLEDWYTLMRSHVASGHQIRRVRIVSEPHSDYTRFGLWLSERNVDAGEDIRYLPRAKAEALDLPNIDYWLFDGNRMYIVRFADDDSLLGAEPVGDPEMIKRAREWEEIAWRNAITRDVYAAQHGSDA